MRTNRHRLAPLAFMLGLVALWQIAAQHQAVAILPGPGAVVLAIVELMRKGLLVKYIVASLFRVTWGFLSATLLAIPLGLYLGWHRRMGLALNPFVQMLRPISPLAWIPIAILWFGVGDVSAMFLIFVASFLPMTVASMNAIRSIDPVHVHAGRNFGLSNTQLVLRVLYPAVMPQLIGNLRVTLGISWLVVVAAEMIAVNSGLGFLIVDARNAGNRYDLVVAGMVTIGVIGLFLDWTIRQLEALPWVRWAYRSQ